jgi:uncharacterized protein YdcH (DUF465 family)
MEEDIKRIESIIQTLSDHIEFEDYDEDVLKEASEDKEALENLLKRYKELEENYNKLFDGYNKRVEEITELEEENKTLTDEYMIQKHLINADFLKDYIPISVIQNKIDELLEKENSVEDGIKGLGQILDCRTQVQVLQELLQESEK